jgi:hypothetical protein
MTCPEISQGNGREFNRSKLTEDKIDIAMLRNEQIILTKISLHIPAVLR